MGGTGAVGAGSRGGTRVAVGVLSRGRASMASWRRDDRGGRRSATAPQVADRARAVCVARRVGSGRGGELSPRSRVPRAGESIHSLQRVSDLLRGGSTRV